MTGVQQTRHEASRVTRAHIPNLCVLWLLRLMSPQRDSAAEEEAHAATPGGRTGALCGAESCRMRTRCTGALRGAASNPKEPEHPCTGPLFLPSVAARLLLIL